MTQHDKTVLTVAKDLLAKGSKEIEIGEKVKDRVRICFKLKKLFPKRRIFTYLSNYKVEFLGGRTVAI